MGNLIGYIRTTENLKPDVKNKLVNLRTQYKLEECDMAPDNEKEVSVVVTGWTLIFTPETSNQRVKSFLFDAGKILDEHDVEHITRLVHMTF